MSSPDYSTITNQINFQAAGETCLVLAGLLVILYVLYEGILHVLGFVSSDYEDLSKYDNPYTRDESGNIVWLDLPPLVDSEYIGGYEGDDGEDLNFDDYDYYDESRFDRD